MTIHIGKIIKELVKNREMSVTAFADKVNYSRRNVYEIFDKETIDTGLLVKIGKVLGENLFLHYLSPEDIEKLKATPLNTKNLGEVLKELQVEVDRLKGIKEGKKK